MSESKKETKKAVNGKEINGRKQQKQTKQQKNGKGKGRPPEVLAHIDHMQDVAKVMAEAGHAQLASNYGNVMKSIGRKCVLRLEPKVKRKFCKKCSTYLNPGTTCDTKIIHAKVNHPYLQYICRHCHFHGKFILNPTHKLWHLMPDFVLTSYETFKSLHLQHSTEIPKIS